MKECQICVPSQLIYQVKFEGHTNQRIFCNVQSFLEMMQPVILIQNYTVHIKESRVKDLFDFCVDHMDIEQIKFRVDNQEWQPFSQVSELTETQWLDQLILDESIVCYAQPIVNVNEDIYSYEMLSRFMNEGGELLSPGEVFAAARRRNRLYALDRLCRLTAVKHATALDKRVFINFIPTSIYSPEHCLKSTVQLAVSLGLNPANITFEVVETDKVEDIDHLKTILKYYKDRGFHYALDDVGTGFSTLEMLKDIAPDYMKLDLSYVQGVATDPDKQIIAIKLLEAAVSLGSIPLAEGVECRKDFIWLKGVGYQLFQGYLFGRPKPIVKTS